MCDDCARIESRQKYDAENVFHVNPNLQKITDIDFTEHYCIVLTQKETESL
jgi:hypothetical protein